MNEAIYLVGAYDLPARHLVAVEGKIHEVSTEAIRVSRYLHLGEEVVWVHPEVVEKLRGLSLEHRAEELEKSICKGVPFYVLGPLPTDCAAGHEHIAVAIGGALAAWAGADFLCYVTRPSIWGFPRRRKCDLGVIAARIAAHVADIVKLPGALDWERVIVEALDPELVRRGHRPRTGGLVWGTLPHVHP